MISKYREAPLGRRMAAKVTDAIIASVGAILLITAAYPFRNASILLFSVIVFSAAGFQLGYLLLADGWSGQSVGKRIFGLKVVNYLSGSPCTYFQSFVRNITGLGVLRMVQLAEEESSREAGTYRGTIVIDVSPPKTRSPASAEPPHRARLDLEGIADYAKRNRRGDG